ncbi:MAG TPA: ATP-grasp domain-containing protein [Candidatus Limnocylindrales bacterium]
MGDRSRLLMIGVDHQALEALGDEVDVTVLIGGQAKDIGLPMPCEARTLFVDDTRSVDACMNALYRAEATEFDAVYPVDDQAMMTASAVGCLLGVRCLPARVVSLFRDKYLQKHTLRQAGIVVARQELIPDIRDIPRGYRLRFDKAVLKPVAGQATESTYLVTTTEDVRRAAAECKSQGVKARTFVVEEFIEGEEWFADGIVSGGRLRFASLGRYAQTCLTAVSERAPVRTFSLDPIADKVAYESAMPVVAKAISTLGLTDGIFHMELFHQPCGGIAFGECAARRGGGPIRDQVRYKFGVDLAYYGVRALLEQVEDIPTAIVDGSVASAYLPLVPGTLLDHPSVQELVALPDVVSARIFVPKGLRTPPLGGGGGNTFGRMGEFTVHTFGSASARLDEVSEWFAARLRVVPLHTTMRELRDLYS